MSEKRAPEKRAPAETAVAAAVLAVVVGVAWAVLAPTPPVRAAGDLLVSDVMPEFYAAQDGVFALLAVAAGVLHGGLVLRGSARLPVALVALLTGLAGSALAWQLGVLLGPPPVSQQDAAGTSLTAPLDLQALAVLGVWPAATATVVFATLLVSGRRRP